jgi:hypothetical protein
MTDLEYDVSLEPIKGPSVTDILLCTLESTNAGFSSFPMRYTSVLKVIIVPLQDIHHKKFI